MIAWIKKYWKILFAGLGAVLAFVLGLVINKERGRIGDTQQSGISGSDSAGQELANGLGKLEANQQSARERLGDLADANQRLATDNKDSRRIIDSAETKLDRLDELLGIEKDK